MERAVLAMLSLANRSDGWRPPVVKTIATQGEGIDELVESIDQCRQSFETSALRAEKKRAAARQRLLTLLEERLVNTAVQEVFPDGELNKVVEQIAERKQDPYSIVEKIITSCRFQRY